MTELNLIPVEEFKKTLETSAVVRLEDLRAESKYADEREAIAFEQARKDDDFWNILETPQDRVKADQDKNGKINYDEYREYILSQDQTNSIVQQPEKPNTVQKTYHLDYSFYIVVGMICLTIITIMWLKKR